LARTLEVIVPSVLETVDEPASQHHATNGDVPVPLTLAAFPMVNPSASNDVKELAGVSSAKYY